MSVLRRSLSTSAESAVMTAASTDDVSTAPVSPAWRCHVSSTLSSPSFADIVRDELLQTATIEHTANKSLALIQVAAT